MRNSTLLFIQLGILALLAYDISVRLSRAEELQPLSLIGVVGLLALAAVQLVRVMRERRGRPDERP